MNHDWLSAHIHFQGSLYGSACDRVILDVVEPFVRTCKQEGWTSQYFFIRYSKDGPHVRLRLRGEEDTLQATVKPKLPEHVRSALPDAFRPATDDTSHELIRWIPYERETNRYGGPDGILLAERFFECSSEICLLLLENCREQGHPARLGKGLLAMIVLLYAFFQSREQVVRLMNRYGSGYLSGIARTEEQKALLQEAFEDGYDRQDDTLAAYVNETWSRLEEKAPLTDALDVYYEDLCKIAGQFETLYEEERLIKNEVIPQTWAQATGMIVPSYLHMTNNRLGIPIPEEAYLAHLIKKTLSTAPEPTPS